MTLIKAIKNKMYCKIFGHKGFNCKKGWNFHNLVRCSRCEKEALVRVDIFHAALKSNSLSQVLDEIGI